MFFFREEISELKKNQQELKRNLSALREPVGQNSSLFIRVKIQW